MSYRCYVEASTTQSRLEVLGEAFGKGKAMITKGVNLKQLFVTSKNGSSSVGKGGIFSSELDEVRNFL